MELKKDAVVKPNQIVEQKSIVDVPISTEKLSDDSSTSNSSIERQLAKMISPMKNIVTECSELTSK